MNRLLMLALASVMALALGACGQSAPPKPEEAKSDVVVEQSQEPSQEQAASAEEAPAAATEAPATNEAPVSNEAPAE